MKWGLVALPLLAVSGAALAEWGFSHWGMTPSQVIAASAEKAALTKGKERRHAQDKTALVTANAKIADQDFTAEYWFDRARRLAWITYWPKEPMSCEEERSLINGKWGNPSTRTTSGRSKFLSGFVQYRTDVDQWALDGNNVMLFQLLHFSHVDQNDVDARELCSLVVAPPGTSPFKEIP